MHPKGSRVLKLNSFSFCMPLDLAARKFACILMMTVQNFTMLEWDDFLNRILVISHYSRPPRKILCPPSYLLLATPLDVLK